MDFLDKYKKHKKISNLSIIAISLVLAISINFLITNNDNLENSLKISILESEKIQNVGDIYIEKNIDKIEIKTNKEIQDVTNLNLSIIYNPENIKINEVKEKNGNTVLNNENTKGVNTIMIEYENPETIRQKDSILTIKVEKKEQISESINIINANFTDKSGSNFELKSIGTIY